MGKSDVERAMRQLARLLEDAQIPYAVIGAMALNEFGYQRMTSVVDVLLTSDGLAQFKSLYLGRGYVEKFPGSRGLRDTENNTDIDVVITGHFPGDGKPKAIAFPDPSEAEQGTSVRLLPLSRMVELKLASGITAVHRSSSEPPSCRGLSATASMHRSVTNISSCGTQSATAPTSKTKGGA